MHVYDPLPEGPEGPDEPDPEPDPVPGPDEAVRALLTQPALPDMPRLLHDLSNLLDAYECAQQALLEATELRKARTITVGLCADAVFDKVRQIRAQGVALPLFDAVEALHVSA